MNAGGGWARRQAARVLEGFGQSFARAKGGEMRHTGGFPGARPPARRPRAMLGAAVALVCLAVAVGQAREPCFRAGVAHSATEAPPEVGIPVPRDPGRIVSLAPSVTEIVFALGKGDRLVGVTEMCDTPPQASALPKVGAFMRPDLERVVSLRPDLCIGIGRSTPEDLTRTLARFGIPVVILEPRDLDGVVDGVRQMGRWLSAEARADTLADAMLIRIAEVKARTARTDERPGVFFQVGVTLIVSVGSRTFIDELITLAGGRNLAAGPIPYPRFSREQVVALRPEILLVTSMARGVSFEEVALEWRSWTGLPAVRTGRVHVVDSNLFDRPSMRLVEALETLSKLIHPESWNEP